MTSHSERVLAAIIPDRRDLLLFALQHLEPEHFRSAVERNLWVLIGRYFDKAGDVMPRHSLADSLSRGRIDEAKQLLYDETYVALAALEVHDHEFRWAVEALKEDRAELMTGEVITTAFEILERGAEVSGERLEGHHKAREYLYGELGAIDRMNHAEAAPEGDMRHEASDQLAEYAERKSGKSITGVYSGIPTLDAKTGGFQNGELALICAYTGQGKSQLCSQFAWDVAVNQGKNVFFGTSETVRRQVRRRITARHSRLPQFEFPGGLNIRDIRDGTLSERGEEVFQAVVWDLKNNPVYGSIYIAQIPRGATLGFLEARLRRQADQWDVHLALFDYLALLKPDRKRDNRREELNDIMQDAKVLATSFYNGKGIPFVSPWQMSQTAWRDAMKAGSYGLANLADTSEAEKSSDQILAIMRDEESPYMAKLQLLKNRDGESLAPFEVNVDYKNAYFGESTEASMTPGSMMDWVGA